MTDTFPWKPIYMTSSFILVLIGSSFQLLTLSPLCIFWDTSHAGTTEWNQNQQIKYSQYEEAVKPVKPRCHKMTSWASYFKLEPSYVTLVLDLSVLGLCSSLTVLSITLRAIPKEQLSGGGCQTEGSGMGWGGRRVCSLVERFCQFKSSCLFNNVQVCLVRLDKWGHEEEQVKASLWVRLGSSTAAPACVEDVEHVVFRVNSTKTAL